jgi:citronellyl-CoA synthetase
VGFSFGLKHYQFVDRVGDTFRWKGENVSTNEIGEIINTHADIHMSNIYGVEIPGTNGRAGMAALILREGLTGSEDLNVADLSQHLTDNLPAYAQPVFLRLLKEQPTTTTMKLLKSDLREQAYHLDRTDDEILVLKPGESVYTRLDREFYDLILAQKTAY